MRRDVADRPSKLGHPRLTRVHREWAWRRAARRYALGTLGCGPARAPADPPGGRHRRALLAEYQTLDTSRHTIYEVNVRQFTPEGTFDALRAHLPRLADLGVSILWLMPIHPIGTVRRKGSLGSYYAVRDYTAVNPEFGTRAAFERLVRAAHGLGLLVILDWVANHTAWDHVWTETDPERYARDADGESILPEPDWDDVINLDYDEPSTGPAMIEAMLHWVREFDVDGFRCDVAERVPAEFWSRAMAQLRAERPLFMLAEGERTWLHRAGFDATYGWGLARAIEAATRTGVAAPIRAQVEEDSRVLGGACPSAFRMQFTTNHDWNSWEQTAVDRFGPALELATVLTFTLPGMPMIYGGQEGGLDRPLAFFERDPIVWADAPLAALYRRLVRLKASEPALAHGAEGGAIEFLDLAKSPSVLAYVRRSAASEVLVLANLAASAVALERVAASPHRRYVDLEGSATELPEGLEAWQAVVLVRRG